MLRADNIGGFKITSEIIIQKDFTYSNIINLNDLSSFMSQLPLCMTTTDFNRQNTFEAVMGYFLDQPEE